MQHGPYSTYKLPYMIVYDRIGRDGDLDQFQSLRYIVTYTRIQGQTHLNHKISAFFLNQKLPFIYVPGVQ